MVTITALAGSDLPLLYGQWMLANPWEKVNCLCLDVLGWQDTEGSGPKEGTPFGSHHQLHRLRSDSKDLTSSPGADEHYFSGSFVNATDLFFIDIPFKFNLLHHIARVVLSAFLPPFFISTQIPRVISREAAPGYMPKRTCMDLSISQTRVNICCWSFLECGLLVFF